MTEICRHNFTFAQEPQTEICIMCGIKRKLMAFPIIEPLQFIDMFVHRPLNYSKYGECPRFISKPHAPALKTELKWVVVK